MVYFMFMRKIVSIIFVLILSNLCFGQSFQINYSKAVKFISLGKRIQAQVFIKRCDSKANKAKDYLKLARIYYSINNHDVKVHEYLLKAFRSASTAIEATQTALAYRELIESRSMVRHSLLKGLHKAKTLEDTFIIARAYKKLLNDNNYLNIILTRSKQYAKNLNDYIKLSDVSYREFSLPVHSERALQVCWKIANNREQWVALAKAYKRVGLTYKASRALNRAKASLW